MLIDFKQIHPVTGPGMNHGAGEMTARIVENSHGKFLINRLHPYGSIGIHTQKNGCEINYVISGSGRAICDGKEELLSSGCCHICPEGSSQIIENTGIDDLVLFTVITEK
ncbi:MAG: cupin domain-containing protein [Hallerella sp.]|jgi:mannose-6-phosphate isomerase-like protein (cupin superfamily)|nr:cupin domain-containing protein [Fibrobacter sp.]MDY6369837.1 cupin domain-containing protein [Fibrobacter sp.]MDY6389099.1 cupin domain-containing protein [Fibrobacter sp.]MEE3340199.1 cupin domain-containing protein [Hallerella sp.]